MILQLENCEPILRGETKALTREEILSAEIQTLIQDMKQQMYDAPGVGLAAPQIGQLIKLAVIEDREILWKALNKEVLADRKRLAVPFHVIINPEITEYAGKINLFFEGCLSIQGKVRVTPRYDEVTVTCLDEHANPKTIHATGWYARILQHEIDHLNGRLYIDLADQRTEFVVNEAFVNQWGLALSPEIEALYANAK